MMPAFERECDDDGRYRGFDDIWRAGRLMRDYIEISFL